MKGYKHFSAAAETKICALKRAGKTHAEIARLFHCHRNSVYGVLAEHGLALPRRGPRVPVLTSQQQAEVLALLTQRIGTGRIAAKLGLRPYLVRQFAEQNGFRRTPGQWVSLAPEIRDKIVNAIREHQNFGLDLAEKYAVSYKVILKVAHDVLKCPKFRSGHALDGPLTSHFPQKNQRRGKLSA